jgi:CheY-like chemotaxis protein
MKKILIIEDNELHAQLMKTLLKNIESEINSFGSAVDAIEWLKTNIVDIILVDIQLPLITGVDFLNIIRKDDNTKHVKCFAVTAQNNFKNKSFKELGFDGHFSKPINIKKFIETIDNSI